MCVGSKSVINDFIHKDRTKMPVTMEYVTLEHKFLGIMIGTNLNVYSQLKQLCKKVANDKKQINLLYNSFFETKTQGFLALDQHAKTKTYVCLCKGLKNGSQTVITGCKPSNSLECFSYNDSIIQSELIWALHVVSQNLSCSSCDNVKVILNAIFPGIIPETFSMTVSSSKISYLISEAVGPYFST